MERYFLILTTLLVSALPQSAYTENKAPQHLGSILDPDDTVRVKKETVLKDDPNRFALDQDFPELPEVLGWELTLTTKAFKAMDTMRTRSDLITAASKGVEYLCLGELQTTFNQIVPPEDPACLRLLKVLESVDPESPVAICTRYGIDSDQCIAAYKTQLAATEVPRDALAAFSASRNEKFVLQSFQNDLTVKLEEEKSRAASKKIQNEVLSLPTLQKTDKKYAEIDQKRTALLSQYLQQSCSAYRLVTIPAKAMEAARKAKPTPRPLPNARKGSSLEDLLSTGPFKSVDGTGKSAPIVNHFRLMSLSCFQALKFAEDRNKLLPAIPCRRDGATSPSCITARRATPMIKSNSVPVLKGGEGLERF